MLPREKFNQKGIDALCDSDLVALIIGSGIKGKNFTKVARSVVLELRKLSVEDSLKLDMLTTIDGIGEITAMKILAGIELGRRLYGYTDKDLIRVSNSKEAFTVLRDMGKLKQERVDTLYLNSRFELLERQTVALGSINCAGLAPRDALSPALKLNAVFVVIAHNHPSGDCTPSKEDIAMTVRLSEAANILGVQLLDHLVIASNSWTCVEM